MRDRTATASSLQATGDSAQAASSRSRLGKVLLGWPAVLLLLAAHWALAVSAVGGKSNTVDELAHITGGYSYWKIGDYRLNAEGGILAQRLMALPLVLGNYRFPSLDQPAWRDSDQWTLGHQFFFELGNDFPAMLMLSRGTMAMVSVLLGLMVYLMSRKLFGPVGGMVSLVLYTFCPALLANGPLAAIDVAASACFLISVWCFWSMLQKVAPLSLAASCLATSVLFLTKMSAVAVLPMFVLLLAIRLVIRRPLPVRFGRTVEIRRRWGQAGVLLGMTLLHALTAVLLIWTFYGLRYSAFASSAPGQDSFAVPWADVLPEGSAVKWVVQFARDHRLLPESYLWGFACTIATTQERCAFMNGQYSLAGWASFFPYCFAVKTPLSILVVVLLGAAAAAGGWISDKAKRGVPLLVSAGRSLLATAPLWVLLATYWTIVICSHINIGHRHILPTYPPMLVLAGAAGWWLHGKRRVIPIVLAAAGAALVIETAAVWPNYLAYFNQLIGGPANGYKHLVDSSLDWGQDLRGLKKWLDADSPRRGEDTPAYLSFFGNASPIYYGINAKRLPGHGDNDLKVRNTLYPLQPGVYCISATMLQKVLPPIPGPWTEGHERTYQKMLAVMRKLKQSDPQARKDLIASRSEEDWQTFAESFTCFQHARLCAYLRRRQPDDNVGYSILIYRLNEQEIREFQYGPPAESIPDEQSPFHALESGK